MVKDDLQYIDGFFLLPGSGRELRQTDRLRSYFPLSG